MRRGPDLIASPGLTTQIKGPAAHEELPENSAKRHLQPQQATGIRAGPELLGQAHVRNPLLIIVGLHLQLFHFRAAAGVGTVQERAHTCAVNVLRVRRVPFQQLACHLLLVQVVRCVIDSLRE